MLASPFSASSTGHNPATQRQERGGRCRAMPACTCRQEPRAAGLAGSAWRCRRGARSPAAGWLPGRVFVLEFLCSPSLSSPAACPGWSGPFLARSTGCEAPLHWDFLYAQGSTSKSVPCLLCSECAGAQGMCDPLLCCSHAVGELLAARPASWIHQGVKSMLRAGAEHRESPLQADPKSLWCSADMLKGSVPSLRPSPRRRGCRLLSAQAGSRRGAQPLRPATGACQALNLEQSWGEGVPDPPPLHRPYRGRAQPL